jgi:hypothetical protein
MDMYHPPKCSLDLYVEFLIASQTQFTCSEIEKIFGKTISHDSPTRWLNRKNLSKDLLWQEIKSHIQPGYLSIDDTLAEKLYSKKIESVGYHYSGKKKGVSKGICLVTATWSNADGTFLPFDFCSYDKEQDDKTKNDHFIDIIDLAESRNLKPLYVQMDTWYSSNNNLKAIQKKGWLFISQVKSNRLVTLDDGESWVNVEDLELTEKQVLEVSLKGFGKILICKKILKDEDVAYWITNDLTLTDHDRFVFHSTKRWDIEEMHRSLKQLCGLEKCSLRKATAQMNHMLCSFIALARFQIQAVADGVCRYTRKIDIVRPAIRLHLNPYMSSA